MRNGDPRLLSAGITRNSTFEADSGALREFVEQLQSRVGELQERIVELQERIVEVERKIGRNSNNSSLPPSRDDAAAREERVNRAARRRAAREAKRRKPGKQPGDPGTHLAQVADPDHVVPQIPTHCAECGRSLAGATATGTEIRSRVLNQHPTTRWRYPDIMRALEREVVDVLWRTIEPLLPPPDRSHPLGCHRPRADDYLCFRGILIRLVTGASWVDVEAILDHQVSDTTLRARRDEWIAAGVFDRLEAEAHAAFDKILGLDLSHVAVDGSLHKAPYGGEETGPNPTDRGKVGWKWSVAADRHGIPIGWRTAAANCNDISLLFPTLDAVAGRGLLAEIETLHLDRSYDYPVIERQLRALGLDDFDIQRRGTKVPGVKKQPLRLGMRWIVETTNTWWSNYGQLRRNTDRRARHRHAALCLATTILIIGKLLTHRDRWSPKSAPIR